MSTGAQDVVVRAEAVAAVIRPEVASSSGQVRAMARFLEVRMVTALALSLRRVLDYQTMLTATQMASRAQAGAMVQAAAGAEV